jgi:quinol monooxygenase YgiN
VTLRRDPTDKCRYTWTEIYLDDQALLDHFDNPAVKDAMGPQVSPALSVCLSVRLSVCLSVCLSV